LRKIEMGSEIRKVIKNLDILIWTY
jgi:hypothetical protein